MIILQLTQISPAWSHYKNIPVRISLLGIIIDLILSNGLGDIFKAQPLYLNRYDALETEVIDVWVMF